MTLAAAAAELFSAWQRISYGHRPWAAAMDWFKGQAEAVFAGGVVLR